MVSQHVNPEARIGSHLSNGFHKSLAAIPICSMYGIFTYIWVIFRENVGKYTGTMEHMGSNSHPKIFTKTLPSYDLFTAIHFSGSICWCHMPLVSTVPVCLRAVHGPHEDQAASWEAVQKWRRCANLDGYCYLILFIGIDSTRTLGFIMFYLIYHLSNKVSEYN